MKHLLSLGSSPTRGEELLHSGMGFISAISRVNGSPGSTVQGPFNEDKLISLEHENNFVNLRFK